MVLQTVPAGVVRYVLCRPLIKQIANVAVALMHSSRSGLPCKSWKSKHCLAVQEVLSCCLKTAVSACSISQTRSCRQIDADVWSTSPRSCEARYIVSWREVMVVKAMMPDTRSLLVVARVSWVDCSTNKSRYNHVYVCCLTQLLAIVSSST